MMLVTALLFAPWVGIGEDETVLHKVVREAITVDVWDTADRIEAVCGEMVQILDVPYKAARVRGTGCRFCQDCRNSRRPVCPPLYRKRATK